MIRNWRTWLVTLGAALVAVLGFAGPAAADVTVSPSEAPRGGPAELTFHISDDRPGAYTTRVELIPPEATPIAEIYPMSVNDWAPNTTMRKLDHPAQLIHGTTTTEVPSEVTWIRIGTPPSSPTSPIDLSVSLGPMPDTSRTTFTVVQTYSDGLVVRWADQSANPAPTVTLVNQGAAGNGDPNGSHVHGDGGQSGGQSDNGAAAAPNGGSGDGGGTYGILGAGLLVGLVAGLGLDAWIILRAVRRASPAGPAPSK
ncbi:DUF1775 domain-containing protein [Planosporangium thailandense]|uniref:DUF1775 domain-containing protein n=1 Tax=Planosporangium thailandense TaxID=765197 RepID=A0ABX0Y6B5_9ACTN|nr:DUF1775 domain-containing protein [Planosporangium thailandense]NJC73950.1 DUF1775 domain-containing protein [Planosporangium thailandense]